MATRKRIGEDLGLLLLRLALGTIFVAHGVSKLLAPGGPSGFAELLGSLGLPLAGLLAYATIIGEIGGGALVALGIFPRLGALALAVIMGVAIVKVHLPNGFSVVFQETMENIANWPSPPGNENLKLVPHGIEYNVALLTMSLAVLFAGGGVFSLMGGRSENSR